MRQTGRQTDGCLIRQTWRQTDGCLIRHTCRQTDRRMSDQTDRQEDRQLWSDGKTRRWLIMTQTRKQRGICIQLNHCKNGKEQSKHTRWTKTGNGYTLHLHRNVFIRGKKEQTDTNTLDRQKKKQKQTRRRQTVHLFAFCLLQLVIPFPDEGISIETS